MGYLDTIEVNDKKYFWRIVTKIVDDTEEHHYRVAESSLENCHTNKVEYAFFNSDYDPPVYFVPLEILRQADVVVIEWCENHGMYFD